jgi:magnesium transporter
MFKKQHPMVGARPGTLVTSHDAPKTEVQVVRYTRENVSQRPFNPDELRASLLGESGTTWVDVQGLGSLDTLEQLAEVFEIHPLALEDMVNVPQRPKVEAYKDGLLIICRMMTRDQQGRLHTEQVSLYLGRNFVVSFQQSHGELFAPIRRRLERPDARLRNYGPDYLAYAIIDTVIDAYYPVLESLGDELEQLEQKAVENPTPQLLQHLNATKNKLVNLRRSIWPQREAVHTLVRDDLTLISDDVRIYLRDTFDHCIQSAEVIDMYRDMATNLLNTYLSSVGHRTNEVMKVLTIMSSIFVPLTFLAGIYGMNFQHMPELQVTWAYPLIWLTMFAIVGGMLVFFYRRGWIGHRDVKRNTVQVMDLKPVPNAKSQSNPAVDLSITREMRFSPAELEQLSQRKSA